MSHSHLYILNKSSVTHYASFHNGWGSAPIAWEYLGQKYLPEKPTYSFDEKHLQHVWDLADDKRLSEVERTCLLMTFDKMYVPLEHLSNVADYCFEFGRDCENGRSQNHWPAFGQALHELSQRKLNRHARGIAIACTSVNDCWANIHANDWIRNAWSIYE